MIPTRIVALGASSVYGRIDFEGGGFIGRLRRWHESQARKNAVFNLGIGGDTSAGLLMRLEVEIPVREPDLILIQTGVNDCRRVGSAHNPILCNIESFTENVKLLISRAQAIAPLLMVSVYPFDDGRTQPLIESEGFYYRMDDIRAYEGRTKEICLQTGVSYIDVFSDWLKRDYQALLSDDGFHANSAGHEEIFNKLRDFFLSHYGGSGV